MIPNVTWLFLSRPMGVLDICHFKSRSSSLTSTKVVVSSIEYRVDSWRRLSKTWSHWTFVVHEPYFELFESCIAPANSPTIVDEIQALKMSYATMFCSNVISCQQSTRISIWNSNTINGLLVLVFKSIELRLRAIVFRYLV